MEASMVTETPKARSMFDAKMRGYRLYLALAYSAENNQERDKYLVMADSLHQQAMDWLMRLEGKH